MEKQPNIIQDVFKACVRDAINTGETCITRQQLLIKRDLVNPALTDTYIDNVRNKLEKCGYINKARGGNNRVLLGQFSFMHTKPIPENMTPGSLYKEYDNHWNDGKDK